MPIGAKTLAAGLLAVGVATFVGCGNQAEQSRPTAAVTEREPATLAAGFQQVQVVSGRTKPVAFRFAPNGQAFVAEKSGLVFEYDQVATPSSPHQVIDLRTQVHNYWDRGLLGLAVHPNYPATPEIYVLYAHDAFADGTGPRWGDVCPDPPGGTDNGCVVYGRLSRIVINPATMTGTEVPLISANWCQQYPSHSLGDMHFGPDGYLYLSSGDGASFSFIDYGQKGLPINPCGDPPTAPGSMSSIATAQGGELRSQDVLSSADPTGFNGSILRLDVSGPTVTAPPDNPLVGKGTADDDFIIATGLRNPYRFNFRPGTSEIWIGDVGEDSWEEIDRIVDPVGAVENFGWPCYEGPAKNGSYVGNVLCDRVFARNFPTEVAPMNVIEPFFAYHHAAKFAPGETRCGVGTSSVTGIAFNDKTAYPSEYAGALFVADSSRRCIWTISAGANGEPDPNVRTPFVELASSEIVDIQMGPDGRIYYVDHGTGTVQRVDYFQGNQTPEARLTATPTSGLAPLNVHLDASSSTDFEDGSALSYAWDLDQDGQFDDGTGVIVDTVLLGSGARTLSVRATDSQGASSIASKVIQVDNTAPSVVIDTPIESYTWAVGQTINFSGRAVDAEDGTLPASTLSWQLIMHHCRSEAMDDCHEHPITTTDGVASGSFVAPDHEYPSYLELRLSASDFGGGWKQQAWQYRRTLTLDHVGETALTNFPVLVKLTPARIDYAKTQSGGQDLRFTDASGNPLAYEIESWTPGGDSFVWVKVPTLSPGAPPTNAVRMYYGNPSATDAQNSGAVWSNGYVGVWHLGASLKDSTSFAHNGANSGTAAVSGAVGQGREFNGSSFIQVTSTAQLALAGSMTLEAWAKAANGAAPGAMRILSKRPSWDSATGFNLELSAGSDYFTSLIGGTDYLRAFAPIDDQFHYYATAFSGGTGLMYFEGGEVTADDHAGALAASTTPLTIGSAVNEDFFSGVIDEVRLSNIARTTAWIDAQHLSMIDGLLSFGNEELRDTLTTTASRPLMARSSLVTFQSVPSGIQLPVGSQTLTTPFSVRLIENSEMTVTAPQAQVVGGQAYGFSSWSNGQPRVHQYAVPVNDSTLTVTYTTQGTVTDADGDGMPDSWENTYGLNPSDPGDATLDLDGEGVSNLNEYSLGTNPANYDTDADGFDDFTELTFGGNPTNPSQVPNPPVLTVSSPVEGQSLVGSSVPVTYAISGMRAANDRVYLSLDGGTPVQLSAAAGTQLFSSVAPGEHSLYAYQVSASGWEYQHAGASGSVVFTVTAAPTSCAVNALARSAATASSVESGAMGAGLAIDGSQSTRWASAGGDPQWLQVDLGAARRVRRVVVRWEAAASRDYDIQVANAAAGPFTTIFTDANANGGVDDIVNLNANARYVRMYSRARTTTWGNSVWELEVYGDTNTNCGTAPAACGNGTIESGEQCDDGNSVDDDACSNACVTATCSDGKKNHGETAIDCGGPCTQCVVCGNGVLQIGEQCDDGNTVDDDNCSNTCLTATCSDGRKNHGETGIDCGGPCGACGTQCLSTALTRSAATSSSVESGATGPALAIDGSTSTRWSSAYSDPQWIVVDLGTARRVRRVVLRWEAAASRDYDVQVGNSASGPWTTVHTEANGDGGVDDIGGLNANARYVRMNSRLRTTPYGNSLWEFEVYGDANTSCSPTPAACGDGVLQAGEQCDDGNAVDDDACSNLCVAATCSDNVRNHGETAVDCGGPCIACTECGNQVVEAGEQCDDGNFIDDDGCSNTCRTATCADGVRNQAETGVDCGGPCPACGSQCGATALTRIAATASSIESASMPASLAIDGSQTSRWSSLYTDPQWIQVDLGSVRRIRRVVLRWEAAASRDYDVQVSDNVAGPYKTIFTDSNANGGVDDLAALNANGRYVRVYSRSRTTPYGNSLFEFEVYGDQNTGCSPIPTECGNGVPEAGEECDDGNLVDGDTCNNFCELASCGDEVQNQGETDVDCGGPCAACSTACRVSPLNRAGVTVSSVEAGANVAAAAIDGSTATRWSSLYADPQWIAVDLGAQRRVKRVVLRWEAAASRDYDLQVGDSATGPWTNVFTDANGNGGVDDIGGLNVNTRYVRMYSRARTSTWGNSLWEFEVYGDASTACTP